MVMASCTLEDSVGNFSIDLGASFNNHNDGSSSYSSPRKESISSISFDASYASVFGDGSSKNKSGSNSTLCHSRWESLGDSNSNIVWLGKASEAISGNSNRPPSFICGGGIAGPGSAATGAGSAAGAGAAPMQRAAMAIKMPRRQFSSHIRTTLGRVSCSTTSSLLSYGESTTLDHQSSNGTTSTEPQQQPQQQQHLALPPRPGMTKFKEDISRRRLLTRAASEKSVLLGVGATTSGDTFAAYSSGEQASNHTFAGTTFSKGSLSSSSKNTFPRNASNHTFASFASFASSNHTTGILSTWESVEEQSLEDSTIASFSSATAMSLASKKSKHKNNENSITQLSPTSPAAQLSLVTPLPHPPRQHQQMLRRHSTGDASSCRRRITRIHSGITIYRDDVVIQQQQEQHAQRETRTGLV
jgi:hypothetical protein